MSKFVKLAYAIAFGLILVFAYMDTLGYQMWNSIDGFSTETYAKAEPHYMALFWGFAYTMIIAVSLIYYVIKKDISESLAIVVASFGLLWGGLEDIVYYIFMGLKMEELPWLIDKMPGLTARVLGYTTVTPILLLINLTIFTAVSYKTIKYLEKKKW